MGSEQRCTLCHKFPRTGQLTEFDGHLLCYACNEEFVTLCDRCGERIWVDKVYTHGGRCLCKSCYEHYMGKSSL